MAVCFELMKKIKKKPSYTELSIHKRQLIKRKRYTSTIMKPQQKNYMVVQLLFTMDGHLFLICCQERTFLKKLKFPGQNFKKGVLKTLISF